MIKGVGRRQRRMHGKGMRKNWQLKVNAYKEVKNNGWWYNN